MTSPASSSRSAASRLSFLYNNWVSLSALVFFIIFPFLFSLVTHSPVLEGPSKFWQGQLITFFIMAVYAMSYDLLMGYTGILSFGQAAFFGGGAYAMALFLTHVGPSINAQYRITLPGGADITGVVIFILAILTVMVVSSLMGLIFAAASTRVKGVYFTMISLAIAEAIHILSKATDFVRWTGADEGLHGIPVPEWINPTQNRLLFYFVALGFVVLMYLLLRRVVQSPTGRIFIAMRENEARVRAIGYNPAVYRTLAFVVSALAAGLAGGLYSLWNVSATPTMTGAVTTINALIMTILGGVGTLTGPILGAGLLQIVGQFFYQWFGPRWPLVFGLIFIALVIFLPYGVIGTWRQKLPALRQAWQRLTRRK